jgi:hypothetical protein
VLPFDPFAVAAYLLGFLGVGPLLAEAGDD